jgi:outer membrane protein OmpA-like peptidoglycan-associated protein
MSDTDNALSHAMTDLMTSLAVIFILLLVIYLNHTYAETQKGSQTRMEKLKTELDTALKAQQITCDYNANKDPLSCTIRVHDDKLQFAFNIAALAPNGQTFLNWLTPRLTNVICNRSNRQDVESVFIQGFTDSVGDDNSNLKLSQERSFQVLSHALNKAGLSGKDKNCLLDVASTNGRGERELIKAHSGKEDSNASRRVEFKIRVKSFELRQKAEKHISDTPHE